MSNQPGNPANPAAGLAAAALGADDANEEQHTDDGVPVGAADARADERRAAGEDPDDSGSDGSLVGDVLEDAGFGGAAGSGGSTDDGVPVGDADVEADRRRASERGGSE
ncbi:hypothetical protein [Terrabacter sp. NPDC080008]|uniref:hypothetical protein n=1 Tax=Terrabacter sp. NPDC080008 TaxID=3155176 RepID=UPI00344D99C1